MVAAITPKMLGSAESAVAKLIEQLEIEITHKHRHDTANRRRIVEAMWIDLYSTGEIMREVSRAFSCDPRTVAEDLSRIKEQHTLSLQSVTKQQREAQMRAQWAELRRACVAAGDRRTAALVNDRLCKMDGLYAPERTEHVSVNVQVNVTLDQVLDSLKTREDLDAFMRVIDAFEAAQLPTEALTSDAEMVEDGEHDRSIDPALDGQHAPDPT